MCSRFARATDILRYPFCLWHGEGQSDIRTVSEGSVGHRLNDHHLILQFQRLNGLPVLPSEFEALLPENLESSTSLRKRRALFSSIAPGWDQAVYAGLDMWTFLGFAGLVA